MSNRHITMAYHMPLEAMEKLVLIVLCDHSNDSGYCFIGYQRLMFETSIKSKSTLAKCLYILSGAGIIEIKSHATIGEGRKVNAYQIKIDETWFEKIADDQSKSTRSVLTKSTHLELIGKINELRENKKRAISTHLEPRKVHTSNPKSPHRVHEPQFNPNSKPQYILTENSTDKSAESPSQSKPQKATTPKAKLSEQTIIQEKFEEALSHYPIRSGGNPKKKAFAAWRASLRAGVKAQDMIDGVIRYRAWCESTGKIGTEFVKQASTFFGPDQHYLEPWTISNKTTTGASSHATKHQKSTALAGQIFGAAARVHNAQRTITCRDGYPVLADDGYLLPALD